MSAFPSPPASTPKRGLPTAAPTVPVVLMAHDDGSMSDQVVRTAYRLFGDDATYPAINVGIGPYS